MPHVFIHYCIVLQRFENGSRRGREKRHGFGCCWSWRTNVSLTAENVSTVRRRTAHPEVNDGTINSHCIAIWISCRTQSTRPNGRCNAYSEYVETILSRGAEWHGGRRQAAGCPSTQLEHDIKQKLMSHSHQTIYLHLFTIGVSLVRWRSSFVLPVPAQDRFPRFPFIFRDEDVFTFFSASIFSSPMNWANERTKCWNSFTFRGYHAHTHTKSQKLK